ASACVASPARVPAPLPWTLHMRALFLAKVASLQRASAAALPCTETLPLAGPFADQPALPAALPPAPALALPPCGPHSLALALAKAASAPRAVASVAAVALALAL